MKTLSLAVVVLLATSASAQLGPASIAQQAEIEFLMERANAAVTSGAGLAARKRLDALEVQMGVRNGDGLLRGNRLLFCAALCHDNSSLV